MIKMTKKEEEQLAKLLKKKEEVEQHDRELVAEVRRRRTEILQILGVNAKVSEVVQRRAAEAGISVEQMVCVIEELPEENLQDGLVQKECELETRNFDSRNARSSWRGKWRKRKKAKNRRKHLS